MTLPFKYQNASLEFERFMIDARDLAGLSTTNMAWNMVVGVLHTFRRRLTIDQALRFAGVLPPILRAVFVEDWHPSEPVADSELRKNFWLRFAQSEQRTTSRHQTRSLLLRELCARTSTWPHSNKCYQPSHPALGSTGRASPHSQG